MAKKYTKEQFWKLYKTLPQELQDALFAEETGDNTYDVCQKNNLEENLKEVVNYVGQVLVGLLPPENFQEKLEKDLLLEKDMANKVFLEIDQLIFYPIKPFLEQLYQKKSTKKEETTKEPVKEMKEPEPAEEEPTLREKWQAKIEQEKNELETKIPKEKEAREEIAREEIIEREKPTKPTKRDTYREPIE